MSLEPLLLSSSFEPIKRAAESRRGLSPSASRLLPVIDFARRWRFLAFGIRERTAYRLRRRGQPEGFRGGSQDRRIEIADRGKEPHRRQRSRRREAFRIIQSGKENASDRPVSGS